MTITELAKQIEDEGPKPMPSVLPAPFAKEEDSNMVKLGPKEAALRAAREDDLSIPAAFDRIKGMTKEEIAKSAERARKNASKALKGKDSKLKPTKAVRPSNLTEADKKAIAEIEAEEKKRAEAKKAASLTKLKALAAEKKAEKAEQTAMKEAGKKAVAAIAPQKPASASKPSKATKATPEEKPTSEAKKGSKTALIGELLQRKEGCTAADVLKATGWPAVSMPQQAKALGIGLRKKKDGKVTRYWAV